MARLLVLASTSPFRRELLARLQIPFEIHHHDRLARSLSHLLDVIERLFTSLTLATTDFTVDQPFQRLTYREAMDRYGNDKPDLRFGMEIVDLSEIAATSSLGFFRSAIESGGVVKAIAAPGAAIGHASQ